MTVRLVGLSLSAALSLRRHADFAFSNSYNPLLVLLALGTVYND